MASAFNLYEFWEKIFNEENQNLEQKVYILNDFASKIRKEFFRNNFMPFLKELMNLVRDIEKITTTRIVSKDDELSHFLDPNDDVTSEILKQSYEVLKKLLIEGSNRWNILVDSIHFIPKTNNGTIKITMPNSTIGLFVSFDIHGDKRLIMFKDIGTETIKEWIWDIVWEYDIPKETIKHILKEKINELYR
jgi:hypothetical protein